MNRAGKPDATLYVHAFDISVERKVSQKTVTKVDAPVSDHTPKPTPVSQVTETPKVDVPVYAAATSVVCQETTGARLATVVRGLFKGSVEDAPDWGIV